MVSNTQSKVTTVQVRAAEGIDLPQKATEGSLAYDLRCAEAFVLPPNTTKLVGTGLYLTFPAGVAPLVLPRSGKSYKERLCVANAPGLIDTDYEGELKVVAENRGQQKLKFEAGEAIAQLLFVPVVETELQTEKEEKGPEAPVKGAPLAGSSGPTAPIAPRGTGGFGSTDRGGSNG